MAVNNKFPHPLSHAQNKWILLRKVVRGHKLKALKSVVDWLCEHASSTCLPKSTWDLQSEPENWRTKPRQQCWLWAFCVRVHGAHQCWSVSIVWFLFQNLWRNWFKLVANASAAFLPADMSQYGFKVYFNLHSSPFSCRAPASEQYDSAAMRLCCLVLSNSVNPILGEQNKE